MRTSILSSGSHARRFLLALLAVTAFSLAASAAARADSVTLAVLTTSGQSDPVGSVSRIFSVSGTSTTPKRVWVKYRPAGGAPCAPSAKEDTGDLLTSGFDVNGSFDHREAMTWRGWGTWTFCMWIASAWDAIANPVAQTVTFRPPSATVTATISPATPVAGQQAAIRVVGSTEAPEQVFAKVRPAGAPCAQTYHDDSGDSLLYGGDANGLFGLDATTTFATAGTFVICLWVAGGESDASPVAGPQPQPVTVIAPTPVVSSAQAYNCSTGRRVTTFRVRSVPAVCMRYSFSATPLSGARVVLEFVRPGGRTHSRVRTTWSGQSQPLQLGGLQSRSYKHRRGTWKAVLRIDGVARSTVKFRVKR
jgi:hypothetical protein